MAEQAHTNCTKVKLILGFCRSFPRSPRIRNPTSRITEAQETFLRG
jgi:hypothetical protein